MSAGTEVSSEHAKFITDDFKSTSETPRFMWWVDKTDKKGKLVKNTKRVLAVGQLRYTTYKESGKSLTVAREGWLCDLVSVNADALPVIHTVNKSYDFSFTAANSEDILNDFLKAFKNMVQKKEVQVSPASKWADIEPDDVPFGGFGLYFKAAVASAGGSHSDARKMLNQMTKVKGLLDMSPLKELETKLKISLLNAVGSAAQYNDHFKAIQSKYVEHKDVTKKFGEIAATNTFVESLTMTGVGETKGYDVIGKGLLANPNSSLTELDVSRNLIGDKGVLAIVKGMLGLNHVKKLNVSYTDMKSKGILNMINTLGESGSIKSSLQTLNLSNNKLGGKSGTAAIATALSSGFENLQNLNLSDTGVSLDSLSPCLSAIPKLTTINLSRNSFTTKDADKFAEAIAQSTVSNLILSEAKADIAFVCTVATGLCVTNDKEGASLALNGIALGATGGQELGKVLIQTRNLVSLNISDCGLDVDGVESVLDSLWECEALRSVYLARNVPKGTSKQKCCAVLDAVELLVSKVPVETVVLTGAPKHFIGEGFKRFFDQMLENPNMSTLLNLDVSGNKLNDDDAIALGELIHKSNMQGIIWGETEMTLRGLKALARALVASVTVQTVGDVTKERERLKATEGAAADKEFDIIMVQAKKNLFHANNPDAVREAAPPKKSAEKKKKEDEEVVVTKAATAKDDPSAPFMHYVEWVNESLKEKHAEVQIEGFPLVYYEDSFRDGIAMLYLIEELSEVPFDDYQDEISRQDDSNRTTQYKLLNLQAVFKRLAADGHEIPEDVEPIHVLQGKREQTAAILQLIKDNYIPQTPEEKAAAKKAEEKKKKEAIVAAKKAEKEKKKKKEAEEKERAERAAEAKKRAEEEAEAKAQQDESLDDLMSSMALNI